MEKINVGNDAKLKFLVLNMGKFRNMYIYICTWWIPLDLRVVH